MISHISPGSLVFLCNLCLIINHVLDGPNNEESIVEYLWCIEYIDKTFVATRKLCSRYIQVLRSVIYYGLAIITNDTSQEEKKIPCPEPNLKCKQQSDCGRGKGPG